MKSVYLFTGLLLLVLSCDDENLFHQVQVVNGSGSGIYELGSTVRIEAGPAPAGEGFYRWTGDTAFLSKTNAPVLTFSMPLQDVSFEATYKDLPTYQLEVIDGTGSGDYLAGAEIAIEAIPPAEDQRFLRWTGDTLFINRTDTSMASVTMPMQPVRLQATFEKIEQLISFREQVFPIIKTKCAYAGCHDANSYVAPLTTYEEIKLEAQPIKDAILSGAMPASGSISQEQIDIIVTWVDQGARDN